MHIRLEGLEFTLFIRVQHEYNANFIWPPKQKNLYIDRDLQGPNKTAA